jgi:hypothetical protein
MPALRLIKHPTRPAGGVAPGKTAFDEPSAGPAAAAQTEQQDVPPSELFKLGKLPQAIENQLIADGIGVKTEPLRIIDTNERREISYVGSGNDRIALLYVDRRRLNTFTDTCRLHLREMVELCSDEKFACCRLVIWSDDCRPDTMYTNIVQKWAKKFPTIEILFAETIDQVKSWLEPAEQSRTAAKTPAPPPASNRDESTLTPAATNFTKLKDEPTQRPIQLFVSYAREDGSYVAEGSLQSLRPYLRVLELDHGFKVWQDTEQLRAGDLWNEELEKAMLKSDIALVLVSVHYLVSDFCRKVEAKHFQKRREESTLKIVPIIVSGDTWKTRTWIEKTQVHPSGETLEECLAKGPPTLTHAYEALTKDLIEIAKKIRGRDLGFDVKPNLGFDVKDV